MPYFPNSSQYSLLKGMWFYHKDETCEIHVYMSVLGKQTIYYNEEKVSSLWTLKTKTEHHFEMEGNQYSLISQPSNVAMTSFESIIRKNDVILKTFSTYYNFDWKRIAVLFLTVFGVNLIVSYLKLPEWANWTGMVGVIILIIIGYSKTLITIKEYDNPITYEDF